jgi:hypothetical protein
MIIVAFHTTAEAFAFEAACKKAGVTGKLGTVPRTVSAGCGFAWHAPDVAQEEVRAFIQQQNLEVQGVYVQ